MKLQPPTVGPILGHTTTQQARIMLRGNDCAPQAGIAAVRYRRKDQADWSPAHCVALSVEHDFTAVIALGNLQAGAEYQYQAGWFTLDSPAALAEFDLRGLDWSAETFRLRTPSGKPGAKRSYIIGSCRYLPVVKGVAVEAKKSDAIFKAINDQQAPIDAVVMVGDQIYADQTNAALPDTELHQFLTKHQLAFGQPYIRELLANNPNYMILDDHEIEDNWPARRSEAKAAKLANALKAYEIYQVSHSPIPNVNGQEVERQVDRYWYQFADGDVEWFVIDARTQRDLRPDNRLMIDSAQEQALLQWLETSKARVKFVVTSVMLYPDLKNDQDDSWKAFYAQRNRLLEHIRCNRIRNVIFVTGDVHASMTCELRHSSSKDFIVHTIVSSPLHCIPMPHAKEDDFILDQPLTRIGNDEYTPKLSSRVINKDNFARVTIERDNLSVCFYDREGTIIQGTDIQLD
ncbi:alkaline phosphatase D family protein [Pseudomonas sp. nanlin1]|uniref:alkaline phosphatase D family protein n=1 Tax=Pseudomonas sp. nanlin1 TaxID=3040605 RepID=UPI00388DA351